jgi:hypothetical protein
VRVVIFALGGLLLLVMTLFINRAKAGQQMLTMAQDLEGVGTQCEDGEAVKLPEKFNSLYLKKKNRVNTPELLVSERIKSIDVEDISSLDLSEVETEANRCFNCGCV